MGARSVIAQSFPFYADAATLAGKRSPGWLTLLTRTRTQLIGGYLLCVLFPVLRFEGLVPPDQWLDNSFNSTIAASAAFLVGFIILRKTSTLPGSAAFMSVFPAFVLSFAIVAIVLFGFRLSYSRTQFLQSFALCVVWFYVLMVACVRSRRLVFGVIPGGRTTTLRHIGAIDTVLLPTVEDAHKEPSLPIVADFAQGDLSDEWERYLAEETIRGRQVYSAVPLLESLEGKVQLAHLSANSWGQLSLDLLYRPAKRYLDSAIALVALILLSPLMLATAAAIRLDSAGPALFRQTRMGFRGKTFTVFKFRSMRIQATGDDARRADMTLSGDDRITRIGRLIRKTRIDELPQIINVLRGEMSWIGPRPETLRLSEWYETEIPFYRIRHTVRPGITGWAQVRQGHVTSVDDVREKLQYDLFYVKHFSVWFDVLIAVHTVRVILTGHGAR